MNEINVWVKSQIGVREPLEIKADPSENIGKFKERCATSHLVENKDMVLMHNEEVLKENLRLKDYGISEGATLELVPKHAPGAAPAASPYERGFPQAFAKRIAREAEMIKIKGLPIKPVNPQTWVMTVAARKGKWKDKRYKVLIELPDDYPYTNPQFTFLEKSMDPVHPNIFPRTGFICFYMFKREGWRPDFTLISCWYGMRWLLENPHDENRAAFSFTQFIDDLRRDWSMDGRY